MNYDKIPDKCFYAKLMSKLSDEENIDIEPVFEEVVEMRNRGETFDSILQFYFDLYWTGLCENL